MMIEAGKTRRMEMQSASTRNAAIRRSVVCEPSRSLAVDCWPLTVWRLIRAAFPRPTAIGQRRTLFGNFFYRVRTINQRSRMNSRKRVVYSLVALLLAGGCKVLGERKVIHIDRHWPAAGVRHLEVDEIDGTINVEAAEGNEITLNAV